MTNDLDNKELNSLFQQSRINCPEEIRNKLMEWENWSLHYFHDMWRDGLISNYEFAELINMVCSF